MPYPALWSRSFAREGRGADQHDAHVGEIVRGAVDEQNAAAFAILGRALDDMDRAALGVDEFADGRKALFDPPRLKYGDGVDGAPSGIDVP
jgi:hypothetical protein